MHAAKAPSQARGTTHFHHTWAYYDINLQGLCENFFHKHTSRHIARAPKQSFAFLWVIGRAGTAPLSRNCSSDIAGCVLYSGGLSLQLWSTSLGFLPCFHCLFQKNKGKERKEGGKKGKIYLRLFLSRGDHVQPASCFAVFRGNHFDP